MGDNRIISMNAAIIVGISGSIRTETALESIGFFLINIVGQVAVGAMEPVASAIQPFVDGQLLIIIIIIVILDDLAKNIRIGFHQSP